MTNDLFDEMDLAILDLVKCNARLSFRAIGKKLKISTGTVSERLRHMQERGIIRGFVTVVNPALLGYSVTMLLCLRISPSVPREEVEKAVVSLEEASCVHYITGDIDMTVLIRARDQAHAAKVLDTVRLIEGVERVDSHMVLNQLNVCAKCGCDCGWAPNRVKKR